MIGTRRVVLNLREGQLPKALENALAEFGRANGIRRVRVLKRKVSVRTVSHGDGAFEKGYALSDNHRVEIYALPDGTWRGEGVSVYDANRALAYAAYSGLRYS